MLGGGVACNSRLRQVLKDNFSNVSLVEPKFCTDNGAMIANYASRTPANRISFPESLKLMQEIVSSPRQRHQNENNSAIPAPDKNLGQHYLNNQSTIESICNDFPGSYDGIIEMSPGPGTLTKTLVKKNIPIALIEKDSRFEPILLELGQNIKLYREDALEFSVDEIFQEFSEVKSWWLVSNLPYNVGTP